MTALVVTNIQGPILELVLNRPEKRNALSIELCRQLDAAITLAAKTASLRCVIIRGEGASFSAGIDVNAFMELKEIYGDHWTQRGRMIGADIQATLNRLERLELPTIALLQGHCLGMGLELALACDFRIAASDTKLGLPEVLLGLIPDVGGTTRLTRVLGPARAKELILTGRTIFTEQADRWGLVNRVVAVDDLLKAGHELAEELSRAAPLAIGMAKRVIDGLSDNERGLQLEGWAQTQLYATEDFQNAVRAFAEKRKVEFKGR